MSSGSSPIGVTAGASFAASTPPASFTAVGVAFNPMAFHPQAECREPYRTGVPHSVLGLIYVLEIVSSLYGGRVAQAVSRSVNLPLSQGFSFLESHAVLDDQHVAELKKVMQSVQESELEDAVLNSVQTNFYLFRQVLGYDELH